MLKSLLSLKKQCFVHTAICHYDIWQCEQNKCIQNKCIQLYVYDLFMKHFKSLTLSFLLMSIKDMWRLKVMTNDRIPKVQCVGFKGSFGRK